MKYLIVATLVICLGWLTYSRLLHVADEAPAQFAETAVVHSNNSPRVASGASTSTSVPTAPISVPVSKSKQAMAAVHDEDLEKRVAPVEDFARRGDPKAIPAVLDALHDDDWRVRSRAMDAAVNAYVPIPENTLIDSAQSDPSPEVRFLALSGVAARIDPAIAQVPAIDRETARSIGQLALHDSSEHVRWQAQQILDTLDAGRSAPAEDQARTGTL
jgi:HEAT repeat protein